LLELIQGLCREGLHLCWRTLTSEPRRIVAGDWKADAFPPLALIACWAGSSSSDHD
jgi:hypothetical protein